MSSIDYQKEIDIALRFAARRVAEHTIFQLTRLEWQTNVRWESAWIIDIGIRKTPHDPWQKFLFDLALDGRTIDAALLEQLHNEVTAWFTKIKEGTQE